MRFLPPEQLNLGFLKPFFILDIDFLIYICYNGEFLEIGCYFQKTSCETQKQGGLYYMRKVSGAFFMAMVLIVSISFSWGAEYVVKKRDNLTKIEKVTGCSTKDLVAMNEIKNQNRIYVGQKIVYISKEERAYIAEAKKWLGYARESSDNNESNVRYCREALNKAGASLETIGTSENELKQLL